MNTYNIFVSFMNSNFGSCDNLLAYIGRLAIAKARSAYYDISESMVAMARVAACA